MVRLWGEKWCVPDKGANEERSEGGEEMRAGVVRLRRVNAGTARWERGEEGEKDAIPRKGRGKEEREGGPERQRGREDAG